MPRDRNGEFQSELLKKNSNEIEEKVMAMYAKGNSVRDIQDMLQELYGIEVSPDTISKITDKVRPFVEVWQNRPLAKVYAILFLDVLHIKLKQNSKVETVAVYNVLGVGLEGRREILGHWIGEGGEGANFWLSVITDLQNRGVQDGFAEGMLRNRRRGRPDRVLAILKLIEISLRLVLMPDRVII